MKQNLAPCYCCYGNPFLVLQKNILLYLVTCLENTIMCFSCSFLFIYTFIFSSWNSFSNLNYFVPNLLSNSNKAQVHAIFTSCKIYIPIRLIFSCFLPDFLFLLSFFLPPFPHLPPSTFLLFSLLLALPPSWDRAS